MQLTIMSKQLLNLETFIQGNYMCLLLSNPHELRTNAIELISTLVGDSSSTYLSQIRLIEQIPLNISTGRDITLRIRNLAEF